MIEIQGLDEVKRKLTKLSSRLENMTPVMRSIGEEIKHEIDQAFENERSPFGLPWRVRKAVGKNWDHNNKRKLLYLKGNLSQYWNVQATQSEVSVGTNKAKEYGAVHQWGSNKTSGRGSGIPARPFLPIDSHHQLPPKLVMVLKGIVEDEIDRVMR